MGKWCLSLVFCMGVLVAQAQFAPQAGLGGSTAIAASSASFKAWGTGCSLQRGYIDIANPSLGYTSTGDSSNVTGIPDRTIVSLGDSGVATVTFANPIYNGAGADFAVFENGFIDALNPSMAFLEFAFVEVSSDGVLFVRFPATSNTQINTQIPGSGVYTDASLINNLAGKYVSMYGTPFDLDELKDVPGLDVDRITHVRIVDVVGALGAYASKDHRGTVINDPYPTDFPTGGFDLDAVGIINEVANNSVAGIGTGIKSDVYPNPATNDLHIQLGTEGVTAYVTGIAGSLLAQQQLQAGHNIIDLTNFPAGMYYLILQDANGGRWTQKVVKR